MAKMLPYYSVPSAVVLTSDRLVKPTSDIHIEGVVIENAGIRAPKLIRREASAAVFLFEELNFEYTCSIQEGLQLMAQKQKYGADANVIFVEGHRRVHPGLLCQFEKEVFHDQRYEALIEKVTDRLSRVGMSNQIVPVKCPSAKTVVTQEMVQQSYPLMTDLDQLVPGRVYVVPYGPAAEGNLDESWQARCYVGSYLKEGQVLHMVMPLPVITSTCSQSWDKLLTSSKRHGANVEKCYCWTTAQLKASLKKDAWLQLNMTLPPEAIMRKLRTITDKSETRSTRSIPKDYLKSYSVSGGEAHRCRLADMLEGKILGKLYPTNALMPGWKDGTSFLHYWSNYNVIPLSQDLWTEVQTTTLFFKSTGVDNTWNKKASFHLTIQSHYDEITNLLQMTFSVTKANRKTVIGEEVIESCTADSLAGIRAMVLRGTKKVLRMLDPIALQLNLSGKVLNNDQDVDWAYHSAWLSGTAIMVPALPVDDESNVVLRSHTQVCMLTDIF